MNQQAMLLGLSAALALAATQAQADTSTRTNTGTNLSGDAAVWTPSVPGTSDIALWDGTSALVAGSNVLNANVSWNGIQVTNVTGALSIGNAAANTIVMTLGSGGIDMSNAAQNVTITNAITLGSSQTWTVNGGKSVTLAALNAGRSISSSAGTTLTLAQSGTGTANFYFHPGSTGSVGFNDGNSFNGFAGNWSIGQNVTVTNYRNGATAWGTGTIGMDGGTIASNGGNWTWTNAVTLSTGTTSSLLLASGNDRYLKMQGVISGSGGLTISSTGSTQGLADRGVILTGTNTMSGTVTINSGAFLRVGGIGGNDTTLNAGSTGTLGDSSVTNNVVNNGTLTFSRSDAHSVAQAISGSGVVFVGGTTGIASSIWNTTADIPASSTQVLTLSGSNTYTGATTVNAGRLNLTGSLTSPITVASGARISGTGSTTGLLTLSSGGGIALAGGATTTSITANGATFSGSNVVTFLSAPTASTVYDVFTYGSGTLTTPGNLTVPYRGTTTDTGTKYTFTASGPANRTWNTTTGTWSIGPSNANWAEGDNLYYDADNVTFGDIASDSAITLTGTLLPGSVTVSNNANKYTFQTGAIGGATSLVKNNAGTLILANNQSYTGGTTVNGGTLRLQGGGSTGTIRGTVTANAGATIEIGGNDSLGYSTGADAVRTINLNSATLVQTQNRNETNTAVINMAGGSTISATGGTNALFDMFGGSAAVNASGDSTNTISSPVRLRQNDTVFNVADGAQATDLLVSGAISKGSEGNGAVVKNGAGTMLLSGTNTHTGTTTVNAGTLVLSGGAAIADAGTVTMADAAGALVRLDASETIGALTGGGASGGNVDLQSNTLTISAGSTGTNYAGTISGTGGVTVTGGRLAIGGTQGYSGTTDVRGGYLEVSGSALTLANSVLNIGSGADATRAVDIWAGTLTVRGLTGGTSATRITSNGSRTLTIDTPSAESYTYDGVIANGTWNTNAVLSFTKEGQGTQTLNGTSTYTGPTDVNAGTLAVNGSIAGSSVTVISGATLQGTGTVGATTVLGTLAPGNSIGTLTISGDLELLGVSDFEIDPDSLAADLVSVTGGLTFGGTLNVTTFAESSGVYALGDTFNLFDFGSQSGTFGSVNLPDLSGQDPNWTWDQSSLYSTGTITVIPETPAALLGALGLLILVLRRRV